MKVIITGAGGQLGHDLVRVLSPGHELHAYTRTQLDVTDLEKIKEAVMSVRPDIVVHAGAYTNVDLAEQELEHVYRINAAGTRNMAVAAQSCGARLVYISTGYVFDGRKTTPYHEFDLPSPLGVYGASKLAGEHYVQMFSDRFFIVRASWLYGAKGNNFVSKIIDAASRLDSISVVTDQFGSPTYSFDLASAIGQLMVTDQYGIYHVANEGGCSRFEFVELILGELGLKTKLLSCRSEQYTAAATRPGNSVFDSLVMRLNGFTRLRNWEEALRQFLLIEYGGKE